MFLKVGLMLYKHFLIKSLFITSVYGWMLQLLG